MAILPTIHQYHEQADFRHYDYAVLRRIAIGFGPDIICGEVRPKDWKATRGGEKAGYCGPSEYRKCLIPLCLEKAIRFEPVDSYRDFDIKMDRSVKPSPREVELAEKELDLLRMSEIRAIVPPSRALVHVIKVKHRLALKSRPSIESATWAERNERICRNVMRIGAKNPSKRILVTIGLEHVPFFREILASEHRVRLLPLSA